MSDRLTIAPARKIVPNLWFSLEAVQAAPFCVTLFDGSRVDHISSLAAETPSGPTGAVEVVERTPAGQPFIALAGTPDRFNHAVFFKVI